MSDSRVYIVGVDSKCRLFCRSFSNPKEVDYFTDVGDKDGFGGVTLIDGLKEKRIGFDCLYPRVKEEDFDAWVEELCEQLQTCLNETGDDNGGGVDPEPKLEKEWKDCWRFASIEKGNDDVIWVDVYLNNTTGKPCYVEQGGNPNDAVELNVLVDLNKFERMNVTELGSAIVGSAIIPNVFPFSSDGLTICGDGSEVDLIAAITGTTQYTDFIAGLTDKYPLPDGGVYGIQKILVQQHNADPKKGVHCDVADAEAIITSNAQVSIVGLGNTSLLTVGGQKPYVKPQVQEELLVDGVCVTCNRLGCELAPADVLATIPVDAAIQVDFCVSCYLPAEA